MGSKRRLMKYLLSLLILSTFLLGINKCSPTIMFDETHNPLHSILDDNGYKPLADFLEENGYTIERQVDPLSWFTISEDVAIIIIATPQNPVDNGFILNILDDWVASGGVLIIITDHQPYPGNIVKIAERFGAAVRNNTMIHPGGQHCTPGVEFCLSGNFTFTKDHGGHLGILGDFWFTTFSGTAFRMTNPDKVVTPIFQYMPTTTNLGGTPMDGEYGGIIIEHGEGRVFLSGEAGAWTCRNNPILVGFCTEEGQFNDAVILALMVALRTGPGTLY